MILILFLVFVSIPILEIIVLFRIGSVLGFWNTVGLLIVFGFIGASLARSEGRRTFIRMQESIARGQLPAHEVLESVLIFVGGLLMITPGFVTDLMGLMLVFPPTRKVAAISLRAWLARQILKGKVVVHTSTHGGFGGSRGSDSGRGQRSDSEVRDIIDIEAEDAAPPKKPQLPP